MPRYVRLPHSFRADERGNVAMIFALTSVVAVSLVGGAVDFGRVFAMKAEMQSVLDAAALAGGSYYAQHSDLAGAKVMVQKFFEERYGKADTTLKSQPKLEFQSNSALISAKASVSVSTPFLSLVLSDSVPVDVTTSVSLGGKKLEVALMFDVTGSMDETTSTGNAKIVDAKAAAQDLIGIVLPDSGAQQARMSLVPFSQRVKLDLDTAMKVTGGNATKQASKTTTTTTYTYSLSTTSYSWESYNSCVSDMRDNYYKKLGESTSTAQDHAEAYCDSAPTQKKNKNTQYKVPDVVITPHTSSTTTYYDTYLSPCAIERKTSDSNRKYADDAPASGEWPSSYTTTQTADVACPPNGTDGAGSLVPLTANASTLRTAVTGLQTGGGTAGHIGTAWSLYTLSPKWASIWGSSATGAEYEDATTMKVAVLMTDGEYNSCNGSQTCTTSDDQALAICTKMKDDYKITVYTIGFGMSTDVNDPARQTLVSCASPDKYYFPYDGDQLRAAFSEIGAALVAGGAGPRLLGANEVGPAQ
jgi:Flp pilus assembly protein TadG